MANENSCHFTGQVKWYKERKISSTFGIINTRVELPAVQLSLNGQIYKVDNPFVWLSIKMSYDNQDLVNRFADSCQKQRYITVSGAVINDFETPQKDQTGDIIAGAPKIRKYSLEVNTNGVTFADSPRQDLNTCIVSGKIESVDGAWITVKTYYKAKKETKFRHVEIVTDNVEATPAATGSNVIVIGQVCGKDPKNNERLYIAANKFLLV